MLALSWLFLDQGVLELAYVAGWWPKRLHRYSGTILSVALLVLSVILVILRPNAFSVAVLLISAYRIFNLLRVQARRLSAAQLQHKGFITSLVLLGYQGVVLIGWVLVHTHRGTITLPVVITTSAIVELFITLFLVWSTSRNLQKSRFSGQRTQTPVALPTLSVCIPARNETTDLEACLQSLLQTDYPKIEVMVLDDCSNDKQTPEIIRGFAHGGVQFISGTPPPKGWLPKNWAYQQLLTVANGEVVLFCGVDIRFAPQSLRQLVGLMELKDKRMLGVMPEFRSPQRWPLLQSVRYAWELVLPRRLFNRPPILSSCWLVTREELLAMGGFQGERQAILPEAGLAKALLVKDGYSFLSGGRALGITSEKSALEQRATALRMRYPQLHRRPELVLVVALIEVCLCLLPIAVAGYAIATKRPWLTLITLTTFAAIMVVYRRALHRAMPESGRHIALAMPLAIIIDIGYQHYSMIRYEFGTVDWKGRNICLPLRTDPHRLSTTDLVHTRGT